MGTKATIQLSKYKPVRSTIFTGRAQGEDSRKDLNLSSLEQKNDIIDVIIPQDTSSLNPSFFLGLFYESIKELGMEKFINKYNFIYETHNPEIVDVLRKNIKDALRNAENSLNSRFSL